MSTTNNMLSFLDLRNGQFSLVQNRLISCYNSIQGVRGTVSIALFNKIIETVYVKRDKVIDVGDSYGSIWSNAFMIDDIIEEIYGDFDDESKKKKVKDNLYIYIKDLLDNNLFYRFGSNNLYSYTYEKNIYSWGYFCNDKNHIYPYTIKKIINSQGCLWDIMSNSYKSYEKKNGMTPDDFLLKFKDLVISLIQKSPSCIFNTLIKENEFSSPKLFLSYIKETFNKLEDFYGYEESRFDIKKIPQSIKKRIEMKDINSLLPKNQDLLPIYGRKNSKSKAYSIVAKTKQLETLRNVSDDKLCVSNSSWHLMAFLERCINRRLGLNDSNILIKNLSLEKLQCDAIRDIIHDEPFNKESFLRDWCLWFSKKMNSKYISKSNFIASGLMSKTLNQFKDYYLGNDIKYFSSLFNEMKEFLKDEDIISLLEKYGLYMSYNFCYVLTQ